MAEVTEGTVMGIRFHKNGVMIIEDSLGTVHVLEPQETLRDVAKYIWREETLKRFRIEGEESSLKDHKEVKFVKLSGEKSDRLRSVHVEEDSYYTE